MKKIAACFLSVAVVVMCSTGLFYAENQDGSMQVVVTPTIQASETILPSSTPLDTNAIDISVTPTPTPTEGIQIPGLTDHTIFNDLLLKKQTLDDLVVKENQICEMIKQQDASNINLTAEVSVISKTYSSSYLKIIDSIKILLSPVKEKMVLNSIELGKIKSKAAVVNNGSDKLEKEVDLSYNQIQSLNMAIKGMRESLKYISIENNELIKKINEGQSQIDKINNSIAVTNKKIIEDKLLKEKEWESFCDAMYKKDLKAASASYDNIILIKERMVKNYQSILLLKKKIEQILVPLEMLQNHYNTEGE